MTTEVLRPHAEEEHAGELAALAAADDRARPPAWLLSPAAVVTYLLGGKAGDVEISPEYVGPRRLVGEVAVATLAATDRALSAARRTGDGETWVGEHLAAAISGDYDPARTRYGGARGRDRSGTARLRAS